MKRIHRLGGILFTLLVFSFFGERGLIQSLRLLREKNLLDRQISELTEETKTLQKQIELFRRDRHTIEAYARKELRLAGEREIQYIFE